MTLASVRHGDGPRPLALLHGSLGSGRNLNTLARRLAERDRALSVFTLDLTGHGSSPPLPAGADLATLAADVLATWRALGIAEPLSIIGHSLGGRVGLRACLLEPAAIAAVTLVDISPSPMRAGGDIETVLDALAAAPARGERRDLFRRHLQKAGLADGIVEWLLTNLEEQDGVYRWRIDRVALAEFHRRVRGEDLWPAVEGTRHYRVRCIRGSLSPYVGEDDARRLRAADCPVDTVEGAGHFVHVDRPAELLALLTTR